MNPQHNVQARSMEKWRLLQPVPEKMRLEMLNEMQVEILNGGEI